MKTHKLGQWLAFTCFLVNSLGVKAYGLTLEQRAQKTIDNFIELSLPTEEAAEVQQANLCLAIRENMDIEEVGRALLHHFYNSTPKTSLEDFYFIIPQTVAANLKKVLDRKKLTVEIKEYVKISDEQIKVRTEFTEEKDELDAYSAFYNVSFIMSVQEDKSLLIVDIILVGTSMVTLHRKDIQYNLRKLHRHGSKDPVLDLAKKMATESTACP